jgi:hypothetical protein
MKLKNLFETAKINEYENNFVKLLNKEKLEEIEEIDDALQRIKFVLDKADEYAKQHNFEKTYMERAKHLIFEDMNSIKFPFIVKGFDASIIFDFSKGLKAKPYIKVYDQNFNMIADEEEFELNESFLKELSDYQRETFDIAYDKLKKNVLDIIKKSWLIEKKRIEKWLIDTPIKIKNNK